MEDVEYPVRYTPPEKWDNESVERWKTYVAPFEKNSWNALETLLKGGLGYFLLALLLVGALVPALQADPPRWVAIPIVLLTLVIYVVMTRVGRLAAKPPIWTRTSLMALREDGSRGWTPAADGPILLALLEHGKKPQIQFEVEYLEPLPELDFPKTYILWTGNPFEPAFVRTPLFVVWDGNVYKMPGALSVKAKEARDAFLAQTQPPRGPRTNLEKKMQSGGA